MFGIEKDFQNLMEQVYGPLNKDKMTEIEKTKKEIEVLTKKLSFLEELEKTKSPVEEAYKRVYGKYPVKDVSEDLTPLDNWNVISWDAFQAGYNASQKDYKVGEYQEPEEEPEELKTLHQLFHETVWIVPDCDEFCEIVKEWMSQYTHNVMTGEYLKGYEECLTVLEENLK
jgi:hypothetical protein